MKEVSSVGNVVVYRGVLQRSRLRLLLPVLARGSNNKFVWLTTKPADAQQVGRLENVLSSIDADYDWEIVDGARRAFALSAPYIRSLTRSGSRCAVVGQSALAYIGSHAHDIVLCMNGIPEERSLHAPGPRSEAASRALWRTYRMLLRRHDTVTGVAVSRRMCELLNERLGIDRCVVAPTAVGREYFETGLVSPEVREFDFCYQGSGAPWQNLTFLSLVWQEISRRDPGATFLVVSYDERCKLLADGLPETSIRFVAAFEPADVAAHLVRARVGFVLRTRSLVNCVSFPTKIGEYLASGLPVVSSDLDWDPADFIRRAAVGTLLPDGSSPTVVADRSIGLRDAVDEALARKCRSEARWLSRSQVQHRLSRALAGCTPE